ncbi:MAG: hypothetical protein HZA94_03415 [Candidatus Vogelbacteria bacterium]|nr:hypothetical protein [Candidatus Vogelbacteria bacterium]
MSGLRFIEIEREGKAMSFTRENIDRAIVFALYNLNGFLWPTGVRTPKGKDPKGFSFIPSNLVAFADGYFPDGNRNVYGEPHPNFMKCSFADYLALARRFARACDMFQIEAVRNILREVLKQDKERKNCGKGGSFLSPSSYFHPLQRGNYWGKAVIALATAFRVVWDKRIITLG